MALRKRILLPRQQLLRRHQEVEIIPAVDLGIELAAVGETGDLKAEEWGQQNHESILLPPFYCLSLRSD